MSEIVPDVSYIYLIYPQNESNEEVWHRHCVNEEFDPFGDSVTYHESHIIVGAAIWIRSV